jgi:hypothetical protein
VPKNSFCNDYMLDGMLADIGDNVAGLDSIDMTEGICDINDMVTRLGGALFFEGSLTGSELVALRRWSNGKHGRQLLPPPPPPLRASFQTHQVVAAAA